MTVWPGLPVDIAGGATWDETETNEIYAAMNALVEVPGFHLEESTNQTITDDTLTVLDMSGVTETLNVNWTVTGNTNVCDSNADGLYIFGGFVRWADNATGRREVRILHEAAEIVSDRVASFSGTFMSMVVTSAPTAVVATDTIGMSVQQTSTGSLDVAQWALWGYWIGKVAA